MINLIPQNAKRKVVLEYWTRVGTIWLWLISIVCLFTAVLLLPVYVLLSSQTKTYAESATAAAEKVGSFRNSSEVLIKASNQARLLMELGTVEKFSSYFEIINELSGTAIRIESFELSRVDKKIAPITVSGRASTRQDLAQFRDRLREHPKIDSVFLPISNLARDRDINFTITVTPRPDTP